MSGVHIVVVAGLQIAYVIEDLLGAFTGCLIRPKKKVKDKEKKIL